jgi:regulatory protein
VTYELRKNGIEAFNLDDIVQQTVDSWMALLEQVYTKKYGHDLLLDRSEWAKRSRFLMHRGFSGTMISALFDHLNIKL